MSSLHEDSSPRWYAIHTHPKQERRAESNVSALGVETFAPKYKSGRRNPFLLEPGYSVKPLFTSYIFARFAMGAAILHKIRYTRGVHSIVSMGEAPVPLDDAVIEIIMSRRDGEGFVKLEGDLKSGEQVVVGDGLFSGFVGVFDRRMKDATRVMILLKTAYYFSVVVPGSCVTKPTA